MWSDDLQWRFIMNFEDISIFSILRLHNYIFCHQQYLDNQLLGCLAVMVHAECGNMLLPWWFCVLTITSVLPSRILGSSAAWFFCGHFSYWMWNVLVHSGFGVFMIMSFLQSAILTLYIFLFFCQIKNNYWGKSNSTSTILETSMINKILSICLQQI